MTEDIDIDQPIDTFNYLDIETVPVIGIEKITKLTWGRFDILIKRYYGRNAVIADHLKLVLDFNSIADVSQVLVGQVINFPDMYTLLKRLSFSDETTDIPGVGSTEIPTVQSIKSNVTIAQPVLNIEMKPVAYDDSTGIITF